MNAWDLVGVVGAVCVAVLIVLVTAVFAVSLMRSIGREVRGGKAKSREEREL